MGKAASEAPEGEFERVMETLRRRISRRELPPHSRLQEHALAEEFGVSRVRIRDVLLALQHRGLVERVRNHSARVIKLEAKQVFEIFDVRESLEPLAVRLSVERNPPEFWDHVADLYAGPMQRYALEGELGSYLDGVDHFRRQVIAAADNALLADLLNRIYDQSGAIIDRTLMLPGRLEKGLRELQEVVRAMRRGDAGEAERLRRDNIRSQRAFVERYTSFVL